MEPVAELDGQFVGLAFLVERDGLADVVHDHMARVAPGDMFLELLADGRVHRAIYIFVQCCKQFRTLHIMQFRLN